MHDVNIISYNTLPFLKIFGLLFLNLALNRCGYSCCFDCFKLSKLAASAISTHCCLVHPVSRQSLSRSTVLTRSCNTQFKALTFRLKVIQIGTKGGKLNSGVKKKLSSIENHNHFKAGLNCVKLFFSCVFIFIGPYHMIYYKLSYCLSVYLSVTELLPNEGSNLNK